jgi:uncharacterized protein DUF3991
LIASPVESASTLGVNAVFPHFDKDGMCGYEIRNTNFKGYSSGGTKALWLSQEYPSDNKLVLCESAIDALSHAVLFPDNHTRMHRLAASQNRNNLSL